MKTKPVTNEELLKEIKELRKEVEELKNRLPIVIFPYYSPPIVQPWYVLPNCGSTT